MGEQTDQTIELTDYTIELCNNSGFGELIDQVSREHELLTFKDKSSIPIPVEKITEGSLELSATPQVSQKINEYIELINTPEGALEYPLLLSGNKRLLSKQNNIENLTPLYNNQNDLEMTKVIGKKISKNLDKALKLAKSKKQNIFIHTHTHPHVADKFLKNSFTNSINPDTKKSYGIKEVGLNIPVRDLYVLVAFERYIHQNFDKRALVMSSIIMYDGTVAFIYIEDGQFKKAKKTF